MLSSNTTFAARHAVPPTAGHNATAGWQDRSVKRRRLHAALHRETPLGQCSENFDKPQATTGCSRQFCRPTPNSEREIHGTNHTKKAATAGRRGGGGRKREREAERAARRREGEAWGALSRLRNCTSGIKPPPTTATSGPTRGAPASRGDRGTATVHSPGVASNVNSSAPRGVRHSTNVCCATWRTASR